MREKDIINNLKESKSNYTSPESAQDQANSLESLSSDIYTDNTRFIYELLQNADDASSNNGKLDVLITLKDNYLTLSHQGEKFSEIDIESICSVGDGNKRSDENKTGFKGIGFKSVFSHSDYVIINTGNYCFKFDKNYWTTFWNKNWIDKSKWISERERKGKDEILKMPWQIIPLWTELDSSFQELNSYNVTTIIQFQNTSKLEKEIFELFSHSQILLFLRSKEVSITIKGNKTLTIEKTEQNQIVSLKQDNKTISDWLIKTIDFEVDNEVKKIITNDNRIPKKLREATRTEISFAIQLENKKIKKSNKESRLIFSYLPTSVNCDFPFLINANFLTDAGRQHLHQDLYWNQWLFKQIPIKFFNWIADLARTEYKKDIFTIIPHKFSSSSELKQAFNKGFEIALKNTAFIPNKNDKLLKVSEAIFDKTNITDFLNPNIVINFINSVDKKQYTTTSLIPYYDALTTLKYLGVKIFEIDNFDNLFNSKFFIDNHRIEDNYSLISFLYKQSNSYVKEEERDFWNQSLRKTSFIIDEDGKLRSPQQIYLPAINFSDEFSDDIKIIHQRTVEKIEGNKKIKNWLEFLGVQEPSDISFIEKTIIGDENYVTIDNAIEVGRYLFNNKEILKDEHFDSLRTFKIITKENNLIKAQDAFLSDFYQPELKLEEFYKNDFYVSENYHKGSELKSEWKYFFIKISIKESIDWSVKTMNRNDLETRYPEYFKIIPYGITNHMYGYRNPFSSYNHKMISFIEFTNQYEFSIKFWDATLSKNLEIKTGNIDRGIGFYSGSIESLNDWIIKNLPIFPTTQGICKKAKETFSSMIPEINELAGKYLPVFKFSGVIPEEWLDYLDFKESLRLDDYLNILTLISKEEYNADLFIENKKRINLIYSKISDVFLSETTKLVEWAESNRLLAKNGKSFLSPKDLSIVKEEGFKSPYLAYYDEKDEKVINLLKIFGVKVIDNVKAHISNSQTEIQDLKKQINYILPLIAVVSVEKSKDKKEWQKEYEKLKSKLTNITFFETTEIWLSYGNEEDKQKRSSWAIKNMFYYVGNWYKPRVLDSLIEPLGRFLGMRYAERHLSVLLSDTFDEGVEYIKEKFGEDVLNLIPDELLNPPKLKIKIEPRTGGGYDENRADIGNKGELFVFEKLKNIYSKKYNKNVLETEKGFEIKDKVIVIWRNIGGVESTLNHDFKIIEGEKEIYIDSKATIFNEYTEHLEFELTSNEYKLMEEAEKYLIARVFEVRTTPSMKFIRINIDNLN